MKRVESHITNVSFRIENMHGEGKKARKQGLEVAHAVVNGQSAGVSIRTINGGQKSAAVNLDATALKDLQDAVLEILAIDEN